MDWTIMTTDTKRSDQWDDIFGRCTLPVKSERPLGLITSRGSKPRRAYELDAARLHPMARARFASTLMKRLRVGYNDAVALVDGWLIDSKNCELETAGNGRFSTRFVFGNVSKPPAYKGAGGGYAAARRVNRGGAVQFNHKRPLRPLAGVFRL